MVMIARGRAGAIAPRNVIAVASARGCDARIFP
jgi:hypothetical protein